ncbi:hypothetical protein [Anaerolentibacter hominis]
MSEYNEEGRMNNEERGERVKAAAMPQVKTFRGMVKGGPSVR